jgi:hypothetical protein
MPTPDPWSEALSAARELARRANVSLSDHDSMLLEKQFPEGTVAWTGGVRERLGASGSLHFDLNVKSEHLTTSEADRLSVLGAAMYQGLFDAATDGLPLTAVVTVRKWYKSDVIDNYPEANETFIKFATTYWTFKALVRELRLSYPNFLLTQLMDIVDGEFYPLFFPYDGPVAIDPGRRARDQARFLRRFAPRIDVAEFQAGNPILLRDMKRVADGFPVHPPHRPTQDYLMIVVLLISVAWILMRDLPLLSPFIAISIPVTLGSVALFWLALAHDGFGLGKANAPGIIWTPSLHIPAFVVANLLVFAVPLAAGVVYGIPTAVGTFAFGRIVGRSIAFRIAKPHLEEARRLSDT